MNLKNLYKVTGENLDLYLKFIHIHSDRIVHASDIFHMKRQHVLIQSDYVVGMLSHFAVALLALLYRNTEAHLVMQNLRY